MDLEKIIIPILTFFNTFEDLQHQAGAFGIKFTHMFCCFKDVHVKSKTFHSFLCCILKSDAKSTSSEVRWTNGLHCSPDCVYGQHIREYLKAVKQTSCSLCFQSSVAMDGAWAGILDLIHIGVTTHDSNGTDARPQRVNLVGHVVQVSCILLSPFTRRVTNNSIVAFDIKDQEKVVLILYKLIVSGENLIQAKECSHGGLRCNYFCHICKVGGTNAKKKSDKRYIDIFQIYFKLCLTVVGWLLSFQCGELHTSKDTCSQIKHQIQLSMLSGRTEKVRSAISQSGIWDAATSMVINWLLELGMALWRRTAGKPTLPEVDIKVHLQNELDALLRGQLIDDWINTLLSIHGLNIHKDTPTEILHIILLGVVKNFWGQITFILNKA